MDLSRRFILGTSLGLAAAAAAPRFLLAQPAGEAFTARTKDGLALSGRAYGNPQAPAIVLIHGLGQSRLSWELQVAPLADRFRVVAYDLRGHGDSDKPADAAAYADGAVWADDLRTVLEATNPRRPTLVGWSLGGLVIGHYLARHGADGIGGVNLVNAVTRLAPELLTETSRAFATRLASPDLGARTEAIEQFLAACFAKPPAPDAFRRMLVFNGMVPRGVQEGIVRIGADGLDEAFARTPRMLVTFGALDKLTSPAMSQRMLTLNPRARLSLYDDVGHTPFYEDPGRFNRELAAFAAAA